VNFDLPIISIDANPEFRDAKACTEWLQTLPLINVGPSHGRLLGELEELNCCELAVSERLKILELLREPVLFVQAEQAKKFSNRAVPLAKPEREILMNVVALWTAFGYGYQHCLQSLSGMPTGLVASGGQFALACQRSLWCASQQIAEHFRCYQDISSDDWALLHRLYAFAEEHKLTDQQVAHPVHKDQWKTTCMETYVQPLLLQAANPSEHTSRQLGLVARWLDRWGNNARVRRTAPVVEASAAQPLLIDLAERSGPRRLPHADDAPVTAPDTQRYLDLQELSKSIRSRRALLKKGDAPASLGLGDDVPAQLAEHLLALLHRQWCEGKLGRSLARKSASGVAELATGMGAMHFYISGLPFRQPGEAKELTKAQREEIATFGRISTHADDEYAVQHGLTLEQWHIRDESLAGLRLERKSGAGRFVHTQLMAVRPTDARHFLLGTTRWLMVDENYDLKIGVRALPGIPQGIAIRATGLNTMADKYVPALMVSAVPALHSPESLVLPVGWFRPKRVIEVYTDKARQMQLNAVLERGADFERVAYEVV